jgi:hypothetical protein
MTKIPQTQVTTNYRLFGRSAENRPLNLNKHKRLFASMQKYGFLPCYPIIVYRDGKGRWIVKEGQHRLAIAESLGLEVYYVETKVDFDVALVNSTPKCWELRDYAQKHAANGSESYQRGLEFAEQYGVPVGRAFSLLAGTTTFANIEDAFMDGSFKVKDEKWASQVASIFAPLASMQPALKSARFLEACMAVCRVKSFDKDRLLRGAQRCREKLVAYATKEAYLDMLEVIYNFGQSKLVGLKSEAAMAMRRRNPTKSSKDKVKLLAI